VSTLYPSEAVLLAPLSGYTDEPFRREARQFGCRYAFTQLIDSCSVVYNSDKNERLLYRAADEPWLGIQMVGGDPEILGRAVELLKGHRFEVLDFNMGCPMPKVTKKNAGASLSHNQELALRCLDSLMRHSKMPVTAKIRIVSETDPEPTVKLARALEQSGIQALTIHGREWEKIYAGPVAVEVIRAVREALHIPVIANGGVFTRADGEWLRRETGCSRIMVARGAIGNPWLFRELADAEAPLPTHAEICQSMERQVAGMVEFYGEELAMRLSRKIILAYLAGRGYRRSRREMVTRLATWAEFEEFLKAVREEGPSPKFLGTYQAGHRDGCRGNGDL
jgi:tRNA-dihydrouridine synthase B